MHFHVHWQCRVATVTVQVTPRSIEEHVLGFHGRLTADDVFYDLGSGDGKIMLQVLLATPAKAGKGIEFAAGREANAKKALERMQALTVEQAEAAILALPLDARLKSIKELLQLPDAPVSSSDKAAGTSMAPSKPVVSSNAARNAAPSFAAASAFGSDEEEDPITSPKRDPATSAEPAAAALSPTTGSSASAAPPTKPSATPTAAAEETAVAMAKRRTPGSNAKRQLFSPSATAQEESKADSAHAQAGASSCAADSKMGKATTMAAEKLVQHIKYAAERFVSIQGDFIVEDFSDATHIFVNNTVFEADLMLRLREKLAAVPNLKALTTLRKICYRHTKRCEAKGESCGAFQHPPAEGICWPTWCGETTLFKYTPAGK